MRVISVAGFLILAIKLGISPTAFWTILTARTERERTKANFGHGEPVEPLSCTLLTFAQLSQRFGQITEFEELADIRRWSLGAGLFGIDAQVVFHAPRRSVRHPPARADSAYNIPSP